MEHDTHTTKFPTSHGHELLISLLEETAKKHPRRATTPTSSALQSDHASSSRKPSILPARRPSSIATNTEDVSLYPTRSPGERDDFRHPTSPDLSTLPQQPDEISKNLFADYEYQAYLDYLTSSSLDTLTNEPMALRKDSIHLQEQLAELVYTEYSSFLRANECTREIRDSLVKLEERLNSLSSMLPNVQTACTSFASSSAADVLKQRRREHLVLNQHSKLVEILEIPQLMDTLIRSGYYEDAMDLQSHVRRLLLRYPHFELLKSVASELDAATKVMLAQLVALLTGDVNLPLCMRVMGYLRRMGALPEPELRLMFLQQRDRYFRKKVEDACGKQAGVPGAVRDHVEYLKKYVDVCREYFIDVIPQYRAIFADSGPGGQPYRTISTGEKLSSTVLYDIESHPTLAHSILSSYVIYRIQHLSATLQSHLPHIAEASQVASICTQTMYFGISMGRLGIDFRGIIGGLFETTIEDIVRRVIGEGVREFISWIRENAPNVITAELGAPDHPRTVAASKDPFLSGLYVKHSAVASVDMKATLQKPRVSQAGSAHGPQVIAAPLPLLAHPPLAHLLNAFFAAYNHLRALTALSLRPRMERFVEEQLTLCAEALGEGINNRWSTWSAEGQQVAYMVARVWVDMLVPAVVEGLGKLFGERQRTGIDMERACSAVSKWLQTKDNVVESRMEDGQESNLPTPYEITQEQGDGMLVMADESITSPTTDLNLSIEHNEERKSVMNINREPPQDSVDKQV